jgi:GT2 family glycosyltransferase
MDLFVSNGFTRDRKYGSWLNILMECAPCEWVMFHDHDIFLSQPRWFDMIVENIEKVPDAGLLTCMCNRLGNPQQLVPKARGLKEDFFAHWEIAREIENNESPVEATRPISGVMMVTSKTAWRAAGGFREGGGIIGIDTTYYGRIIGANYKVYIMTNLYVYHKYRVWDPVLGTKEKAAWALDKRNPDYKEPE